MSNRGREPIRLELDPGSHLIAGRLIDGARGVPFARWLELASVLEAAWLVRGGGEPEDGDPLLDDAGKE